MVTTRKAEKDARGLKLMVQVSENVFECLGCGFRATSIKEVLDHIEKCQYVGYLEE
jgi:hypothetical protein